MMMPIPSTSMMIPMPNSQMTITSSDDDDDDDRMELSQPPMISITLPLMSALTKAVTTEYVDVMLPIWIANRSLSDTTVTGTTSDMQT